MATCARKSKGRAANHPAENSSSPTRSQVATHIAGGFRACERARSLLVLVQYEDMIDWHQVDTVFFSKDNGMDYPSRADT